MTDTAPPKDRREGLLDDVLEELALCINDGADDIAGLLGQVAAQIEADAERIAALEGLLSMVMEASEYDERKQRHVGWNITRLNKARPLLQSALAGTNPSEIARIAALEGALRTIASQAQAHEMDDDTRDGADFDEAYDLIIYTARAALKGTDNDPA